MTGVEELETTTEEGKEEKEKVWIFIHIRDPKSGEENKYGEERNDSVDEGTEIYDFREYKYRRRYWRGDLRSESCMSADRP